MPGHLCSLCMVQGWEAGMGNAAGQGWAGGQGAPSAAAAGRRAPGSEAAGYALTSERGGMRNDSVGGMLHTGDVCQHLEDCA